MRVLIVLFLFLWTVVAWADFFPGTEDIPLMPGIGLPEANDFSFDSPAGQILIFEGTTDLTPGEIRRFYDTTLKSLGWRRLSAGRYVRGSDDFRISFPARGRVRFDMTLSTAD